MKLQRALSPGWLSRRWDLLLPSRRCAHAVAILDRLQARLAWGRAEQAQQLALLVCAFDNFRGINDSHSPAAGDLVLTTTADRLRTTIRQNDHRSEPRRASEG